MGPVDQDRIASLIAAFAGALYITALVIVPVMNRQLDVLATHPEDYAAGVFGFAVNVSYGAFAVALVALAVALHPGRRLAALWPALLIPPAALCGALAFSPSAVARSGDWVSLAVVALAVAPLAISIAMRERFGALRRPAIALAAAAAVAFLCLAASPPAVSGLVNRLFDILAGGWVVFAAIALRSEPRGAPRWSRR